MTSSNDKICSSCGANGHSRVTYKGCPNYGKPKAEWARASEVAETNVSSKASTNVSSKASTTARRTAAPTAPPTASSTSAAMKKSKWINSKAKELLRNDIISGKVTNKCNPETVHKSNEEYTKWPFPNFKTNLKNLLEAVALDYRRMAEDWEAYGHDIDLLLQLQEDDEPLSWHQSEAHAFLSKDIDAGKHKAMHPSVLWESRIEYMEFPLKTFRDHIYQELKKRADLKTKARFQKKGSRMPPPPRADIVDEVAWLVL